MSRHFTTSLVRWALGVRVASVLVVLLLPLTAPFSPRVALAVALLGCWSLVWLAPRDGTIQVARRHPIVVVGDTLVAVIVTAIVGVDSPLVFATLSTALVIGVLFRGWTAALLVGVLVAGYLVVALAQTSGPSDRFAYTFIVPATYVVLALLGGVTRRLHEQVLLEQARLAHASATAAASAERARLARDMHDSLAKSLHGVALAAAALPRWVERDTRTAVDQATVIREAAEQASREARELLVSLRSRRDVPVVVRLTELVREFESRTGIPAALEVGFAPELDPDATHELGQIVAEALENVHRHAGASQVTVRVRDGLLPATVEVSVIDDGTGFDPEQVPADHFGLLGMRERADGLGGHLDVEAAPGAGTAVTLQVPEQRRRQEVRS